MTLLVDGRYEQFRCSDNYHNKSWYDWCLVQYFDTETGRTRKRAGKLLGIVKFDSSIDINVVDAMMLHVVLRVSDKKVSAAHLQRDFVHSFKMGGQSSLVVLPVSSIVGPLATFTNYGGADNEHYAILPHRKWGKYFSDRIVVPDNSS